MCNNYTVDGVVYSQEQIELLLDEEGRLRFVFLPKSPGFYNYKQDGKIETLRPDNYQPPSVRAIYASLARASVKKSSKQSVEHSRVHH